MGNVANLRLLLIANAVSQFAQGISMIAIPWYFINQLEDAGLFTILFFVVTGLTLFWSPYAGSLIDRFHRKKLFITLCVIGALLLLSIAFTGFYYGETPLVGIGIIFGFTVLNYNLHYPALYALAQEMTSKGNSAKTNSLLEIQGQATSMLSGAFAAILISGIPESFGFIRQYIEIDPWPLHYVFLMDGITYLIAIAFLLFLRHQAIHEKNASEVDLGRVLDRIKLGIQYLKEHPRLFRYGMFSYFVFVTVIVHMFYIIHAYVSNVLLAMAFTLALSQVFHTVGALSAGFVSRKLFTNKRIINTKILMIGTALVYLSFYLFNNKWLFACGCLFIGFANSSIRILRVSYLFDHVPHLKMGRVASVFQSGNILLRLVLIGLFYSSFFQANVQYSYLVMFGFILIALLPIWKMRESKPDSE